MTFENTHLFAILAITAAVWTLIPADGVRIRAMVLAIASPIALVVWIGLPIEALGSLGAGVIWIYLGLGATRALALR